MLMLQIISIKKLFWQKKINGVDDNGDTLSDYDDDKDYGGERFLSVLAVLDERKNI